MPGPDPSPSPWRPTWQSLAVAGSLVGLAGLFTVASLHAFTGNSDGATVVLEGNALVHGNFLLRGWRLSLDSFWTVDAPVYAVGVLVVGVREILVYLVPAVIATLVVATAMVMARAGRQGGAAIAGVITAGVLLIFPTHTMAMWFLQGPLHVGTLLLSLGVFWCLRHGRFGWRWVLAVLLLVAGMNGDLLIVAYAVVPLLLSGVVAVARCRSWRAGMPNLTAALVGGGVGEGLSRAFVLVGGYAIARANPTATVSQMVTNVRYLFSSGADLIGARNGPYGSGGVPQALQEVHVLAAVLLAACLLVAIVRLIIGAVSGGQRANWLAARNRLGRNGAVGRQGASEVVSGAPQRWYQSEPGFWRLDDMLTIACFGPPCTYVVLAFQTNPAFDRYLTATVVLVAIVTARVVSRQWSTHRRPLVAGSAAVLGSVVAICFAVGFAMTLASPVPLDPEAQLATWLSTRHLDNGVGAYWCASATTVASSGTVKVRPVVTGPSGQLERYPRQSSGAWYSAQPFTFLVYQPSAPWGGVDAQSATATWGHPSESYTVGSYTVLVWHHPFRVDSSAPAGLPDHR